MVKLYAVRIATMTTSAFRKCERTARKEHWCRGAIPIGARYVYVSGVWDGRGDSFKFCLACWKLHEDLRAIDEEGCGAPFGDLGNWIEDGGDAELRERWRAVRALEGGP